jgi:hypothetical protein
LTREAKACADPAKAAVLAAQGAEPPQPLKAAFASRICGESLAACLYRLRAAAETAADPEEAHRLTEQARDLADWLTRNGRKPRAWRTAASRRRRQNA